VPKRERGGRTHGFIGRDDKGSGLGQVKGSVKGDKAMWERECSRVIGLSEGLGLGECDGEVSKSESRERKGEKVNREGGDPR
jgi:hypothetical protein